MKLATQKLMILAAALSFSTAAFAGTKDLKIFKTLVKIGAENEQFMSQAHLGLDNVECAYSNISGQYDCNMTDISADGGNGAPLNLVGKKAHKLFDLLAANGAISDNGMGKVFLSVAYIRCTQAVPEVAEGSEADRTWCGIEPEIEQE